ncbi:carbamoyltransferase C-terminal domain-containing protein [Streptomyces sp. NPDC047000]|uniref:carbamoyltransferase family protein n=1 Tax=Streptomyces sp. NPDC047000 TaxID=3155474 RepID=UPI0033BFFC2E
MLIAGVNMGRTCDGRHRLKDGAACLLRDGEILVAIAEERLSRRKHDGGHTLALDYCLASVGATYSDLDMVAVSTCAEEPLDDGCDLRLPVDRRRIFSVPSHHLSHAHTAYMLSPFTDAAIMVMDNEGTIVGRRTSEVYWRNRVERNTYYTGDQGSIERLDTADDGLGTDELGPGEAYRHFTYYLGWHSYVYAGNTMGLAPYGDRRRLDGLRVFDLRTDAVRTLLRNGDADPARAVVGLAAEAGIDIGPPRLPHEALTPHHADIAALIQDELEAAVVHKARSLQRITGSRNLCVGGGVALNCVALRRILEQTDFDHVYTGPTPGDTGQCVGNALYAWTTLAGGARRTNPGKAFFGRRYSAREVEATLMNDPRLRVRKPDSLVAEVAGSIARGYVTGWFQGPSELGPRALGARSILADPRPRAMRDYLNLVVKHREPFRPFAPSVLIDHAAPFFDVPHAGRFMEIIATATPMGRERVPAVIHVDGSARLQALSGDDTSVFAALLREFHRNTGIPMVLNTSFNLSGEPMVETPADAVDCFLRSDLDLLAIEGFLVSRSTDPHPGPRFHQRFR